MISNLIEYSIEFFYQFDIDITLIVIKKNILFDILKIANTFKILKKNL